MTPRNPLIPANIARDTDEPQKSITTTQLESFDAAKIGVVKRFFRNPKCKVKSCEVVEWAAVIRWRSSFHALRQGQFSGSIKELWTAGKPHNAPRHGYRWKLNLAYRGKRGSVKSKVFSEKREGGGAEGGREEHRMVRRREREDATDPAEWHSRCEPPGQW